MKGGHPRNMGPGLADDDGNLCWEITRVLLIVGAVLVVVLSGVYYAAETVQAGDGDDD